MYLERELARRRRSTRRDEVEWLAVGLHMIKNPLDDIGLLNARDHPQRPAAAPAALDLDRKQLRKQTVEPVFGIIKSVMGFRQFLLCGLKARAANGVS
jgi:hypothetical protein